MKVNEKQIRRMGKETIIIWMAHTTKELGPTINKRVVGLKPGLMELLTRDFMWVVRSTEKENLSGQMALNLMGSFRIII